MSKFDDALQAYRVASNAEAVASVNREAMYDRARECSEIHTRAIGDLDAARDALLNAAKEYPGTVTINDGELRVQS
jgi:hypothetical protein